MAKNDDREKIIELAESQLGNRATKYRSWFYGYDAEDVAWCAIFVSWIFAKSNVPMIRTDGAGCFAREGSGIYGKWYESEYSDNSTKPRKGDIITFVWNYSGRYYSQDKYYSDHVGIVYAVDEKCVYTIEGNSGGSNDTSSVKKRMYSRKDGCINGYFRPFYTDGTNNTTNDKNSEKSGQEKRKMNNLCKGDVGDCVLAYKTLLTQANMFGIIKNKVDNTNGFGTGTEKATLEFQKLYKLEEDGIAGVKTITALKEAVNNKIETAMKGHNALIDDLAQKLNEMKV